MDRATNSTAPADRLFCAVELSKSSWLLGSSEGERLSLKGGDSEGLMAQLVADIEPLEPCWTLFIGSAF
jgi:hypothetical protein